MVDLYSRKHHYGNKTYKGVLSKNDVNSFIESDNTIIEIVIYINDDHHIIYFSDDILSYNFICKDFEVSTAHIRTPYDVVPRPGVETGLVTNIDEYLVVHGNTDDSIKEEIFWSYHELQQRLDDFRCKCGNPDYGFDCVCDHVRKHPGDIEFSCEFCGLYNASEPRCNKCEAE